MGRGFWFLSTLVLLCALYAAYVFLTPITVLCDKGQCPLCYGTDLCARIHHFRFRYDRLTDYVNRVISAKNVYYAEYEDVKVVVKKLPALDSQTKSHFKYCDGGLRDKLALRANSSIPDYVNMEPVVLNVFGNEQGWPVPKLWGACGLVIVESYEGEGLNTIRDADWPKRAYVALQLLEGVMAFTGRHPDFRLYLTDLSPDNVVVNAQFRVSFVDLEDGILQENCEGNNIHHSRFFEDDDFIYDEGEICQSSKSDHNIYAVCRLLLSAKAPWPMMIGGLLHTPPEEYKYVLPLVENCMDEFEGFDRFKVATELIQELHRILKIQ